MLKNGCVGTTVLDAAAAVVGFACFFFFVPPPLLLVVEVEVGVPTAAAAWGAGVCAATRAHDTLGARVPT